MALFQRYPCADDLSDHEDVLAWCSWYREHASQSSLVRRFAAIKHYYNWLIKHHVRPDNPCNDIHLKHPSPPVKEPFTVDELRQLLAACRRPQEKAIVLLLIDTGLRLHEVSSLRPENIDLTKQTLKVRGKGDKERMLAFGHRTSEALRAVSGRGYVWHSQRTHGQMTRDGVYLLLKRLGKRTGIHVYPHRFRTTFAVLFDERTKGDVGSLQVLMGHSKVTTTLLYTQHGKLQRALQRQREVGIADTL